MLIKNGVILSQYQPCVIISPASGKVNFLATLDLPLVIVKSLP